MRTLVTIVFIGALLLAAIVLLIVNVKKGKLGIVNYLLALILLITLGALVLLHLRKNESVKDYLNRMDEDQINQLIYDELGIAPQDSQILSSTDVVFDDGFVEESLDDYVDDSEVATESETAEVGEDMSVTVLEGENVTISNTMNASAIFILTNAEGTEVFRSELLPVGGNTTWDARATLGTGQFELAGQCVLYDDAGSEMSSTTFSYFLDIY